MAEAHVIGFTVAFAVCPVWAGLVLGGRTARRRPGVVPLNATTLILSFAAT